MDEPLSNLDAKLRVQTRTEILRLHKRLRNTDVYVAHDQVEAMTMAEAPPREVDANPVNAFVAGFIGSPQMNFFNVDMRHCDEGIFAHRPGAVLPLSPARLNGVRGNATLGIRADDVLLSSGADRQANPSSWTSSKRWVPNNTPS